MADIDHTERETRAEIAICARGIARRSILIAKLEKSRG